MDHIEILGAREHNLKNIDVEIPRNKITSLVGVSGSGKSTVVFDIIFSEGQRQFLESLDTYAARLLQRTERPDVDDIKGLSPTIMIEQRQLRESPRSTVGTVTEIYTYLRLLFSRAGSRNLSAGHFSFNSPLGCCEKCKGIGTEITIDQRILIDFEKTLNDGAIGHTLFKPSGRYMNILKTTKRVEFDKPIKDFSKKELDFLLYSPQIKLRNASQGFVQSYSWEGVANRLVERAGDVRGISTAKSKTDAAYWLTKECSTCGGARLNKKALAVTLNGKNIGYFASLPITSLTKELVGIDGPVAKPIVTRMKELLDGLIDVGIGYVSLNRSVDTLSAGEAQRIKLARELGSTLIETIYLLDEPTTGLHPRDVGNVIRVMKKLRDSQNTVIAVEHDASVMLESDYLIELGPGGGKFGGEVVATGSPREIMRDGNSLTGKYLSGKSKHVIRNVRRKPTGYLGIKNATLHNLKNISVKIPTGVFTAVTGVSGSGKSTLINDVFSKQYRKRVVLVDQSPVGSSPRGNIATYTGAFDIIRRIVAKENGVDKALFSSNGRGACQDCKGLGHKKVDMHFMASIKIVCEACDGKKYSPNTLRYEYHGKNIFEILQMTADEAIRFFNHDELNKKLGVLRDIGLDYLNIGQTLDTLSGGESQRLKLAESLHKRSEFYILDEPTAGLHFADVEKLLGFLHRLVDEGNSVLVIEHNLDVMASADWIIDLGPEGGDRGGEIVAEGTPEDIISNKESYTGQWLAKTVL
ncbi:MAG: excinuclease ABC subunit UvrA [Candidatus Aenigmatarchaeota archaeon]|nr:MAG: excinuclease ABC subunit UvrA [Candidatus Aenigmarchaeota archaeon]